jgi:hypothetical protein
MRVISVRGVVIAVTVVLFVATLASIALAAFGNWRFGLPTSDKTTVINTVVAVGAFVLVAWGVVVALAAYVSATGTPDLSVEITFRYSYPNKPVFKEAQQDSSNKTGNKYIEPYRQVEGDVIITNNSKYSARNPGVRIMFEGLGGINAQDGWQTVSRETMAGNRVLQWDGGSDYMIHGKWSRTLRQLDLRGMYAFVDNPAIVVTFAADGFDPVPMRLPVTILSEPKYLA